MELLSAIIITVKFTTFCRYGSPTMDDIEAFSFAYRLRLDEAEAAGTIPKDISLEVPSFFNLFCYSCDISLYRMNSFDVQDQYISKWLLEITQIPKKKNYTRKT